MDWMQTQIQGKFPILLLTVRTTLTTVDSTGHKMSPQELQGMLERL